MKEITSVTIWSGKMKKKIVYQDGDYVKVLYGAVDDYDDFMILIKNINGEHKIGKRYIISISDVV